MLEWVAKNMPDIDFHNIYYYSSHRRPSGRLDMLPEDMKNTYEKLGIPEAERKFLAGVTRSTIRDRPTPQSRRARQDPVSLHRHRQPRSGSTRDRAAILGTVFPPAQQFAALTRRCSVVVPSLLPPACTSRSASAYFRINSEERVSHAHHRGRGSSVH